jgi:hypothetical protein
LIGIRVRNVGGELALWWTSYLEPRPPPPIYSAVRRGSTNHIGLGASDQGARTRPKRPLGLIAGDQNLTPILYATPVSRSPKDIHACYPFTRYLHCSRRKSASVATVAAPATTQHWCTCA